MLLVAAAIVPAAGCGSATHADPQEPAPMRSSRNPAGVAEIGDKSADSGKTPADSGNTPSADSGNEGAPQSDDPPPAEVSPDPDPPLEIAADGTRALPCGEPPPGMSCVPGGPFLRGADDGPKNAAPAARIWLQSFYIDQNEVTYAAYKACVRAKECPRAGPAYTDFDRPQQPINGISWHDAVAYCRAQGKRLPTEAEWEKAARGTEGELYPWGDEPATCERAILKDASGRGCGVPKAGDKPEVGRPWEVGSRPAYRYGLYDMSGNSWEWVADWYAPSYEACGAACQGINPRGPCDGAETCPGHRRKIVRGGSWYWPAEYATAIYRRAHVPDNKPFHHFGFRCAADLQVAGRD